MNAATATPTVASLLATYNASCSLTWEQVREAGEAATLLSKADLLTLLTTMGYKGLARLSRKALAAMYAEKVTALKAAGFSEADATGWRTALRARRRFWAIPWSRTRWRSCATRCATPSSTWN